MNKLTFSSDVIFVIASLLGIYMSTLNMAAKLALIMLNILTVKSKSCVRENKCANVSNIFYIICIMHKNSFWKVS